MEQKTLSRWLKCIIVGVGICGLMVFAAVVPMYAVSMRTMHPRIYKPILVVADFPLDFGTALLCGSCHGLENSREYRR